MANTWARVKYDDCYVEESINQSVGPMAYRLFPGMNTNCSTCRADDGPRQQIGDPMGIQQNRLQSSDQVDFTSIDSKLKNITHKYHPRNCSEDPRKLGPEIKHFDKSNVNNMKLCERTLNTNSSRLDYPSVREVVTFDYHMNTLPEPAQNNVNYMEPMSSRDVTKRVYDGQLAICNEFKKMKVVESLDVDKGRGLGCFGSNGK